MTYGRCRFAPLEAESSAVGASGWQKDDNELWLIKLPQGVRLLRSSQPLLSCNSREVRASCCVESFALNIFGEPDSLHRKQVDVSELDGKKCELGGTGGKQTSRSAIKLSDGSVVGLQPSATGSQYLSSFVCNSEKRWVVGKPFAREINVVQRFDFASKADACPKINVPVPMHVLEQQKFRSCAAVGGASGTTTTRGAAGKEQRVKKVKKPKKEKKQTKEKKKKKK